MRTLALAWLFVCAPLAAQSVPMPEADNPRIQTIAWQAGETVLLTALPHSGLTVMLEREEEIVRASIDNASGFEVKVSPERNSFLVLPTHEAAVGRLSVTTQRRDYAFELRTGNGLTAAYLVRFAAPQADPEPVQPATAQAPATSLGRWKMKGDRELRPAAIRDDGAKTWIEFGEDQPLPAIFAIGPTGKEEVVNGHMRAGQFVIDRVHGELVFRIDKDKATARRETGG